MLFATAKRKCSSFALLALKSELMKIIYDILFYLIECVGKCDGYSVRHVFISIDDFLSLNMIQQNYLF